MTVTIISTGFQFSKMLLFIISTGTHFLGNHYQIALKNHQITDDMIVEMHILQTNWQCQVS